MGGRVLQGKERAFGEGGRKGAQRGPRAFGVEVPLEVQVPAVPRVCQRAD